MRYSRAALLAVSLLFAMWANAALHPRASGQAYYDDVLDVTWAQDANWLETSGLHPNGQVTMLVVDIWLGYVNDANYLGINTWRLPQWFDLGEVGCDYTWDNTDCGWNMDPASGELWYNHKVNLGTESKYISQGVERPPEEWGVINSGPFQNIEVYRRYLYSNPCPGRQDLYLAYHPEYGGQHCDGNASTGFIWLVTDGDPLTADPNYQQPIEIAADPNAFYNPPQPGDPEQIDPNSTGNLNVVLFSTQIGNGEIADFDATLVDATTVKFGPAEAAPQSPGVINTPDWDHDGDNDRRLFFAIPDTGLTCDDTEITVTGRLYGSTNTADYDFYSTQPIETIGEACESQGCHSNN